MINLDPKAIKSGIMYKKNSQYLVGEQKETSKTNNMTLNEYSNVKLKLNPMRSQSTLENANFLSLTENSVAYSDHDYSQHHQSKQSIKLPTIRHHSKDSV